MIKKKEFRLIASSPDEKGRAIMEQDAETIKQITPGFELPPKIVRTETLAMQPPAGTKPILSLPMKKDKEKE